MLADLDGRVLRGEQAAAVGLLSTPELRTGTWTRFGGERGLGDPVTEEVLSGLAETDRKSTRLNSSHSGEARMPSSA